ncbi:MAG: hypothetical protein J6Y68_05225 [Clostridia bacterium]|nr:hypothetical protein [Clostridia bacterium]
MKELPPIYLKRIASQLNSEMPLYLEALSDYPSKGLHVNTMKASLTEVEEALGGISRFLDNGYITERSEEGGFRPSQHPYYAAGLYYIQEPSAMLPVMHLSGLTRDNPLILDMCAAPGGKTSQLACLTNGKGTIVANEIDRKRSEALRENIVRMGYPNVIVTNLSPKYFEEETKELFDVVLLDAPCSGEGMFRKEDAAIKGWSVSAVEACAARQREIIKSAEAALKQNGLLVYSTCTFSEEEDERNAEFIASFGFKPVLISDRIGKLKKAGDGLKSYPHIFGEGQYFCIFRKEGGAEGKLPRQKTSEKPSKDDISKINEIFNIEGREVLKNGDLFYIPSSSLTFPCTRLNGTLLGRKEGKVFVPAHQAFVSTLKLYRKSLDFPVDSKEVVAYLSGAEIDARNEKGWSAVTVNGHALGGVKCSGGIAKNHYPKGLRNESGRLF